MSISVWPYALNECHTYTDGGRFARRRDRSLLILLTECVVLRAIVSHLVVLEGGSLVVVLSRFSSSCRRASCSASSFHTTSHS